MEKEDPLSKIAILLFVCFVILINGFQSSEKLYENNDLSLFDKEVSVVQKYVVKPKPKVEPKIIEKPVQQPIISQPIIVGVEKLRSVVAEYFPPEQVNNALMVIQYESGGNLNATNWGDYYRVSWRTPSAGIFQHNPPLPCHQWSISTQTNNSNTCSIREDVKLAYDKWNTRGWQPWYNTAIKLGLL